MKMKFPSPCGVNIVANVVMMTIILVAGIVSVPLRGKYRGEWPFTALLYFYILSFPSPCGVNIVANIEEPDDMDELLKCFRPLAG